MAGHLPGSASLPKSSMQVLAALLLLCLLAVSNAACPHAMMKGRVAGASMPAGHPQLHATRKLQQATLTVTPEYLAAMARLIADFENVIGKCQFSLEGMAYRNNDQILVASSTVFFPAASWLRAFFHDAGTFIKAPGKGGPKGGPNGSLGVGCATNPCGALNVATVATPSTVCLNGAPSVGGFSDGQYYCCPAADQCIAHGQSSNTGPTPGLTVPVCLKGNSSTVELCRRENDGLQPTIQFLRGRQLNPTFQYNTTSGLAPVSMADIIVAGAVVVVNKCSGGAINITHTFGRPEATVADDVLLPSPDDVIEQQHFQIFQNMGLNKIDMVTLVTGSHSIGGFRKVTSPGLTNCPYVPFDCTPAGQIASPPFDNNVFKVACDGVQGVSKGECKFNQLCTNPSLNETATGCPFDTDARVAYQACNATSYPTPGLKSDIFLCNDSSTKERMVQYAKDQSFFFTKYADLFANMASLGFKAQQLTTATSSSTAPRRRRRPRHIPRPLL